MLSTYALAVDVKSRQSADMSTRTEGNSTESACDSVSFSVGNPRVEHVRGVAHLYRNLTSGNIPNKQSEQSSDCVTPQPDSLGSHLAVLAVQPEMGVSEFCTFVGGFLPSVRTMRFVRQDNTSQGDCLVLLQFESDARAAQFYKQHNNQPFWTLEPDILCRLVFVKDVQLLDESEDTPAGSRSPTVRSSAPIGSTELPTCPVCLERLDNHISGIVTTVCNHKFHNECLLRWADTSCPVCRYCLTSGSDASRCSTCDTNRDLWICLICGHVGCGRYHSGHARQHWQQSSHCYALELSSQRVWDYINDAYVHRLVHSIKDGRLVEVPSPATTAAAQLLQHTASPLQSAPHDAAHAVSSTATEERYEAEVQEALVASKLDAIGAEYSARIQNQMQEQMEFFEGRIATITADYECRLTASGAAAQAAEAAAAAQKISATESARLRSISDGKLEKASAKVSQLARERDILEQLNKQMRSNQQILKDKLRDEAAAASERSSTHSTQIADLQEQVRDLMMFIEGQRMVEKADPKLGLHQGTAAVPDQALPANAAPSSRRRSSGRKR